MPLVRFPVVGLMAVLGVIHIGWAESGLGQWFSRTRLMQANPRNRQRASFLGGVAMTLASIVLGHVNAPHAAWIGVAIVAAVLFIYAAWLWRSPDSLVARTTTLASVIIRPRGEGPVLRIGVTNNGDTAQFQAELKNVAGVYLFDPQHSEDLFGLRMVRIPPWPIRWTDGSDMSIPVLHGQTAHLSVATIDIEKWRAYLLDLARVHGGYKERLDPHDRPQITFHTPTSDIPASLGIPGYGGGIAMFIAVRIHRENPSGYEDVPIVFQEWHRRLQVVPVENPESRWSLPIV